MAWDVPTFRSLKPEFGAVAIPDAVIATALADAARRCDVRIYRADTDAAVGLLAAHLLVLSPYGEAMRLVAKDRTSTTSTYYEEWLRLTRQRAGGPWTAGQTP